MCSWLVVPLQSSVSGCRVGHSQSEGRVRAQSPQCREPTDFRVTHYEPCWRKALALFTSDLYALAVCRVPKLSTKEATRVGVLFIVYLLFSGPLRKQTASCLYWIRGKRRQKGFITSSDIHRGLLYFGHM